MKISSVISLILILPLSLCFPFITPTQSNQIVLSNNAVVISPKVMIVSMFEPEEEAWTSRIKFTNIIKVLGLSAVYPSVRCTPDYSICQFTTGEGEINAGISMAFLLASAKFNLSKNYWLLAGIAGGEPTQVTTGSVTFAKYAVQVGLQYQIDSREILETNANWLTGYFSYGTKDPWTYPDSVYGTEVFELNGQLRDKALNLARASKNKLAIGDDKNIFLRSLYDYRPASESPQIHACDVLTSDNYFTGQVLSEYFGNYTKMITNGTATYCATAQEENATLEALLRMAEVKVVDFNRIVVMRTISNLVRAPPSLSKDPIEFFNNYPKGGIQHALDNLYIGGWPFVEDVVENWESYNEPSLESPHNYVGDILGRLGQKPNFGKDSYNVR